MVSAPAPAGARRTQAERRAGTRARLLDATIGCLSELGYARTSTTEVVQRAGLSRGAQVHHFPTKAELVVAAVQRLFDRRLAEFRDGFARLPPGTHTPEAAIDLLWPMFTGPTFAAWLELLVAARTDADLRERVVALDRRFHDAVAATYAELFPDVEGGMPFHDVAASFTFALLGGLAAQSVLTGDGAQTAPVIDALKLIARLLMPPAPTGKGGS